MKRLWPTSPPPDGLQGRREQEAGLFEAGLRETKEKAAALSPEPPPKKSLWSRLFG